MNEQSQGTLQHPKCEMIICIINAGFSETVMDAAKEAGAKGGTVIRGRGTANRDAEKIFQIAIQPDKEIVMIIVPEEIRDSVMKAIYDIAGIYKEGQGIVFSLPVKRTAGLKF